MGGAVKVRAYAESPEVFQKSRILQARNAGGANRTLTILWSRPVPHGYLLAFHEIDDRTAAEALAGAELHVDRAALPKAEDNAYYWVDLIGLRVHSLDRGYLGRLEWILRTGSNDVFVVREGEKETLVPALESVVVSVDVEGGSLVVDLPEGL